MKTIYKLFNPPFLRRLDEWLLGRYPVVWRTQGHYVLFYALLAAVLLFVAGFCWPVSVTKLMIDPINPIELGKDELYLLPMLMLSSALFSWAYEHYQPGFPFYQTKQVGATLLIYAACFYMITAIAAPAFKLGALVRTAWFLMEEEDMEYWEANDFFAYGFLLKDSDTLSVDAIVSTDSFFQVRETEFRQLRRREDRILEGRYNSLFIDSLFNQLDQLYRSDLSALSYRSYLSGLSYLSDMSDMSYLSYRSYESYRSYLSFLPDGSHLLDRPDRPDRPDRSYMLHQMEQSLQLDRLNQLYRSDLLAYEKYYQNRILPQINGAALDKYALPMRYDTAFSDRFHTLTIPIFIYQMEAGIRSVRHAQQYLGEVIFFRHACFSLMYLPLLACLLFAAPFIAFRPALLAIGTVIAGYMLVFLIILLVEETESSGAFANSINVLFFFALPVIGFLILMFYALEKKQGRYTAFAFHLILTGLFAMLFSIALDLGKTELGKTELAIYKPIDVAFFGVQAIGVAGALLMAYVQKLPKQV